MDLRSSDVALTDLVANVKSSPFMRLQATSLSMAL